MEVTRVPPDRPSRTTVWEPLLYVNLWAIATKRLKVHATVQKHLETDL